MSNTSQWHPVTRTRFGDHRNDAARAPRRRRRAMLAALGFTLVGAIASTDTAATASTITNTVVGQATPVTPVGLPSSIEALSAYVPQTSCDPVAKPGSIALGRLLTGTYGGSYTVVKACGTESVASEHVDGRAVDWMVSALDPTQKARAEAMLTWLFATDAAGRPFANARRLGVMYVIWNNKVWGSYNAMAGWRPYSTCAAHPESAAHAVCHRDRLHLSLSWAGAMARTSYWTKTVAATDYGPCRPKDLNWAADYTTRNSTACPTYPAVTAATGVSSTGAALIRYSGAQIEPGDSGPVVTALQKALGVTSDGVYGQVTATAVIKLQTGRGLAPSGALDADTWRALLAMGFTEPVAATPKPIAKAPSALTKYKNTVVKYDSRGASVLALQKALKVTASGWFGPKTQAAVVAFQKKKKLPATGIVATATWVALGA